MGTFLIILCALFWIVGVIGFIWLLFEAYGDDQHAGWLCMILWPYGVYYCITQIDGRHRWLILALWLGGSIPGAILFELVQKY